MTYSNTTLLTSAPVAGRISPVSAEWKSSFIWVFFCRMSFLRFMSYSPPFLVRAFDHRSRLGLSVSPPFGVGVPH